jgi:peptidyl-prolyl isomerase E (cyclophilin E)
MRQGGFGEEMNEEKLYSIFSSFGDIVDVTLPPDPSKRLDDGPSHRGFGYIEFQLPADALDAIDNMHQNELHGKQLKCHLARPKPGAGTMQTNKAVWQDSDFLESVERKEDKSVAN